MELTIGAVARRTGLTERTLRYYEEAGLLAPPRDAAGRRRYDAAALDRLYRIRLLRALGTPVAELDPTPGDLAALTRRHLADLDARLAEMARTRERVRAVEARLLAGEDPGDEALLDLLAGLGGEEPGLTRRVTLLVYADLAAAHRWLVDVFALAPGPVHADGDRVVHAEVYAGDGVVWLHPESERFGMFSPASAGLVTASLAVHVEDVDAHHARVRDAGAEVVYEPTDMPYGFREYSARDLEGHLWSFQTPLADPAEQA